MTSGRGARTLPSQCHKEPVRSSSYGDPSAFLETASAAAAATAIFLGLGFVHLQGATAVVLAIQGGDGRLGFLIGTHFDKSKPFALAGVAEQR